MKKKVFITGITGMVGSHLLDFLIKNTNWEIHGLIRWRSSLENIEDHILNDRISGAKKFNIEATPTLIINGKKFDNPQNYKKLKKTIEKLI